MMNTCTACGMVGPSVTAHYIAGRMTDLLCVPCTRPLYPEPPAPPREWVEWTDQQWADYGARLDAEERDNQDVWPRDGGSGRYG